MGIPIFGTKRRSVMSKPAFNPEADYTVVGKPPFDPSKPFDLAPMLKEPEAPKPPTMEEVLNLVRSEIAKIPKSQPQIINKIVERVEIKEEKKEDPRIKDLQDTIKKLEKRLEDVSDRADRPIVIPSPGGSGVIGIPPPEAASVNQVLTVNSDKKAQWKTATGGSGGLTAGTYSVSNPTDVRTFDANDTSLDEIADVLGTLISDLGGL